LNGTIAWYTKTALARIKARRSFAIVAHTHIPIHHTLSLARWRPSAVLMARWKADITACIVGLSFPEVKEMEPKLWSLDIHLSREEIDMLEKHFHLIGTRTARTT